MVINNIKSCSCIIVLMVLLKLSIATKMSNFTIIQSALISLSILFVYFWFGYLFLRNIGSFKKNFLSVLMPIIMGFIVWGVCFFNTDYKILSSGFGDDGFMTQWWTYHDTTWCVFMAFSLPAYLVDSMIEFIVMFFNYTDRTPMLLDIIGLFYVTIPSLVFCLGINLKKYHNKRVE